MPGRSYSSTAYKYGFNGKEKDDEVKGSGNTMDFGARMYDSRLGRWFAVDPKAAQYTSYSPYHAMYDNPIIVKDNDGEENIIVVGTDIGDGKNRTVKEGRQMREHFLYSAINNHYNELQKQGNGERTKILLFSTGDDKEDNRMKQIAFKNGVANSDIQIVKNADDIQKYIDNRIVYFHQKDPLTGVLLPNGIGFDLITDLIFVCHGSKEGALLRNPYTFHTGPNNEWIMNFDINRFFPPEDFSQTPSFTFEMCRKGSTQYNFVQTFMKNMGKGSAYSTEIEKSTEYFSLGKPTYHGGMVKTDSNGKESKHGSSSPKRSQDKSPDRKLFNPRF